jgi:hypothetical protein
MMVSTKESIRRHNPEEHHHCLIIKRETEVTLKFLQVNAIFMTTFDGSWSSFNILRKLINVFIHF